MKHAPPKYAIDFLRWFCREDYIEEIEGDLTEIHGTMSGKRWKANFAFTIAVIRYFRPGFIKSFKPSYLHRDMFKNYMTISWRNLYKQKGFSAIKIGGLALGIAATILISLFLRHELTYDQQYAPNLYRVVGVFKDKGTVSKDVYFPAPFGQVVDQDFEEVFQTGRYNSSELFGAGPIQIRREDQSENSYEEGMVYFDQSLLSMLDLRMVYGSQRSALAEPNTLVLTKSKADIYFPGEDPVGKLMIINNDRVNPYKVGGVVEDFSSTSHINFSFLVSMTGRQFWEGEQTTWGASNYPTYLHVREGVDIPQLAKKISDKVLEKYYLPFLRAESGMTEAQLKEMLAKGSLQLQPVKDIYLTADVRDGLPHSDMRFIWLFGTIAAFILIIACINFVNLSTAKSANRAKEVGVRKVMGSFRKNLVTQFLTESFLITFISLLIGVVLVFLLLPTFNAISGKNLELPAFDPQVALWLFVMLITVAFLAGLYPSFYLASFKPIAVLKGSLRSGSKSSGLRGALVVFQFTASIILLVSTLVIYRQMDFILSKDLGFNKDQVLLLQGAASAGDKIQTLKNELREIPGVSSVSVSGYLPIKQTKRNGNGFWKEGHVKGEESVAGQIWRIDGDYLATIGIELKAGRNFDSRMVSDSSSAIINEAMVRQLNLSEPVGAAITNGWEHWTVVGVVKDFHFESLKHNIEPLCLVLGNSPDIISIKMSSANPADIISAVTTSWKKFVPHQPLRYNFLDDRYEAMYRDVERTGKIFTACALFAIVVACLGLFGLASFMAEQRSKEVSIRLVLGASINEIFTLLTRNFVGLVAVSLIVATPISWYLMDKWLEEFVYRIELGYDVFIISGLLAMVIALMTVSYQSLKVAMLKPVDKLRSE